VGTNFAWTSTSGGRIPADALVAGETATKENLYVGRVVHDGTLTIGKVRRLSRGHRVPSPQPSCLKVLKFEVTFCKTGSQEVDLYVSVIRRPNSVAVAMNYGLDVRGSIPTRRK
jgi:hypothetical protein